jgi:tripartite-type tricarboxylate transporter receptor subunit TctC
MYKGVHMRVIHWFLAAIFGSLLVVGSAHAQLSYPTKPIRLIVPFPPGGAADILARGISPKLGAQLGQQVIVDNRPGSNGVIGFDLVAKAPADGYTLLLGFTTGVAVNPVLIRKISYDPVKSFAPISLLARTPMVLIATPTFRASSVQELITLAKATPGKITYASPGTGNPNHLAGELFKLTAGVDLVHVPYKGAALVVTDVLAGHVPTGFVTLAAALPQLRAGKLKALAVTSDKRSAAAPAIPTMTEFGVPGVVIVEWFGILAPAATPSAVTSQLNKEINNVTQSPEVQARFTEQGLEPITATVKEFVSLIKSDMDKLAAIIKKAGIRAE